MKMIKGEDFSYKVVADSIHEKGAELSLSADDEECALLAQRFFIEAVNSLNADISIHPAGKRRLVVTGRVTAEVVQTCVVSLDPVVEALDFEFSRLYASPADNVFKRREQSDDEEIDFFEDDIPDPIEDGTIDLGDLVAEEVALSLPAFPRKEGVEFDGETGLKEQSGEGTVEKGDEKPNPFAVLASLKDKMD